MKTLFFSYLFTFSFLCLLLNSVEAQQIQLIDEQELFPISEVFFNYGSEQGLSDIEGRIKLKYQAGLELSLSHLGYEAVVLKDEEVQAALKAGKFYLSPKTYALQPVTVVQLRPTTGSTQNKEIGYTGQMMPDAGAYLSRLPGLNAIKRSAAYGFDPVLRGFKNERLLVLIDGVQSTHEACPNRMDPPSSQVPLNSMSSVSIQKGPYSLRYGAVPGGVINFSSVKARFSSVPKSSGRFSSAYESNIKAVRSEGMAAVSAARFNLMLFGAYAQGHDYQDGDGFVVPADFNRVNAGAQLALKTGEAQTLTFSVNHNRSKDIDFAAAPMDLGKDQTWLWKASYRIHPKLQRLKSWNSSAFFTTVDHRMDNFLKPLDPRMMNAWTDAQTQTYGGRTESQWAFENSSLYAGFDFKTERAQGNRIREFLIGPMAGTSLEDAAWQDAQIDKAGFFAEWHVPKGQMLYILSARLDYNKGSLAAASDVFRSLYDQTTSTHINPSFSAGFSRSLNQQTSIGLWAGRVLRSPSISERYIHFLSIGIDPYEMLGNPELKAEKSHQVDFIFRWESSKLSFQFDAFTSLIQDYISSVIRPDLSPILPNSPGVRQYINISKAFRAGFEAGFRQTTAVAGMQQALYISYTYGQDLDLQEALPEIPPLELRYHLQARYLKKRLQAELAFRYAFAQNRIASSYGETNTPAFYLVDLALAWNMKQGIIRSGVNNLFDQAYYEHLSRSVRGDNPRPIYNPGRSFFVSFSIHLP